MKLFNRGSLISFFSLITISLFLWACSDSEEIPPEPAVLVELESRELAFINADSTALLGKIQIEVADELSEITTGLMGRASLAADAGMLFVFQAPDLQFFTMQNTLIPLDIIFVDASQKIVKIQKSALPDSIGPYESGVPVLYVVEVNGGYTDSLAIGVGDQILFAL